MKNLIPSSIAALLLSASSLSASAEAKYIFYFIGDGMGIQEVASGELFNRQILNGGENLLMRTFPVSTMISTFSANSDVTDSAAAGTALSTGVKTKNGMLGMTPDSVAVTSMAKVLFDDGYGVGLVTTCAIDDATPAAFYTHVPNRGMVYEIGRDLADSGYQFMAGAGLRGVKDKEGKPTDLMDHFYRQNVNVSYGYDNLDPAAQRQLLLSPFHEKDPNNTGYTIDSIPGALQLADMTAAGISHLQRVSPEKFFMMIENGNIDHSGHSNDGATNVREVATLDKAVKVAYDFYLQHPDETLIVITADHETGGMSLGSSLSGYAAHMNMLGARKVSKDAFNDYCRQLYASNEPDKWGAMKQYLADNFGAGSAVPMSEEDWAHLKKSFDELFSGTASDERTLYKSYKKFVGDAVKLTDAKAGIAWTTPSHTGTYVPVYVIGADCQLFTNPVDNTNLPKLMLKSAGK